MGSMLIRNIPDDVVERFKARAKAEGKSAEQFAREALIDKAKPSREDILAEMDALRAQARAVPGFDVVEEIGLARDERDERTVERAGRDAAE